MLRGNLGLSAIREVDDIAGSATQEHELFVRIRICQARVILDNAETSPGQRVCRDCGDEISQKRLMVVPGAIRCTTCEGIWERTHPKIPPPRHLQSR